MDKNGERILNLVSKELSNKKSELEQEGINCNFELYDIAKYLWNIEISISESNYIEFREFFNKLAYICCTEQLSEKNINVIIDSLSVALECIGELKKKVLITKKCNCCQRYVRYLPLSNYYVEMKKRYGGETNSRGETLNEYEYTCPVCGASDRDRLIIEYLLRRGLPFTDKKTKVLQIAPAASVEYWIRAFCKQVSYESTDLYMDNVTFKSDIQNMTNIMNDTYDYVICSHVLEHVKDDLKAMSELERIIKSNGKVVFLVPIDLNRDGIDEEWGLSEAENWKRFGQGDHCRAYSKKGLLERLEKIFSVEQLGKDYFGTETYNEQGFSETSTLYILGKK